MAASQYALLKAGEWRRRLLHAVTGLLVFETVTGLSILLLPFSIPNQVMVLLHTIAGFVFIGPFLWYQWRHWQLYRSLRVSHVVLTGYAAMVASLVLMLSGVVLTIQSLWGTRIARGWDLAHTIATFALLLAVLPHIVTLVIRARRAAATTVELRSGIRRFAVQSLLVAAAWSVLVPVASLLLRPPAFDNNFSADYSYAYGRERPFAPSLATTTTGGAFDTRSLDGSKSCGTAGCHRQIYDEWAVSAHRYAAMDPAFQKVQEVMATQNGAESTRYCGGCHDPISLFSGTKNIFAKDLTNQAGYQEGVSCISCHSIKETDVKGNANYTIAQPRRYLFELEDRERTRWVRDFLIRSYPGYHVKSLEHKLFKRPEFCAACHKQFIDEEINQVGWVQLQNQFDAWRKSRWNEPGNPARTIECRECHMPLQPSTDPGRGDDLDYNRSPDDGRHRSHRFLGANQFIPTALKLPGAEEHVALTGKWLRGEIEIPEIAAKWRHGAAVPLQLLVPGEVRPGAPVAIQAKVTNSKVGHDFPTGPLDIIQAWVEVSVTDQDGRLVYQSGQRDARHFIAPGSFLFKAEPVDQYGNLIDRHNLWEMVGVRYRRSVFPGLSDQAEFRFRAPAAGKAGGGGQPRLQVEARLMYRKIDQFLLNFLFGEQSGLTAPATVVSEDRKTIRVTGSD